MAVKKTKKTDQVGKSSDSPSAFVTDEERRKAIEVAAYYRWLGHGGNHGDEMDDWLEAEEEVMQNVFDRNPGT
jgi:hypothetical protein